MLPYLRRTEGKAAGRRPVPPAAAGGRVVAQGNLSARRQAEQQADTCPASAKGKKVCAGRQGGEKHLAAGTQLPGGLEAALPVLQRHAVPGTAARYTHPDQTQLPAEGETEILLCLSAASQTEDWTVLQRGGTGYWLTFALTRYSPSVTPPNRYFPSALVLVPAMSCSVVTPPMVVTWYRPTKQPATAAPL